MVESSGTGVAGGCGSSSLGAGTQTQVFSKSSKHSELWSHLSSSLAEICDLLEIYFDTGILLTKEILPIDLNYKVNCCNIVGSSHFSCAGLEAQAALGTDFFLRGAV